MAEPDPMRGGYQCHICGARFFIPDFLNRHLASEHPQETKP